MPRHASVFAVALCLLLGTNSLAETRHQALRAQTHWCQKRPGVEPCVCAPDVPAIASYFPSDPRCPKSTYPGDTGKNVASVVLRKGLRKAFSTVLRTYKDEDRSPYEPALCTMSEFQSGQTKCSRWKGWRTLRVGSETVICFGASGYSKVFRQIGRISIKVSDFPGPDGKKDVRRYCLVKASEPLNPPVSPTPTPTPTPAG